MSFNVEKNKEVSGKIYQCDEINNNNIKSENIRKQTKNTVSGGSGVENIIGIIPTIRNIVSTAYLCCMINLKEIALQAENTQYNPKKFPALFMRIKEPKSTARY